MDFAREVTAGALRLSELASRALDLSFLVVTYSPEGKIWSANPRFVRQFECAPDELPGQSALLFFASPHQCEHHQEMWQAIVDGEARTETEMWTIPGGREVWLESRYIPLFNEAGAVEAVVQIAEDITARLAREAKERSQPGWGGQALHGRPAHHGHVNQGVLDARRQALLDAANTMSDHAELTRFLEANLQGKSAVLALLYLDIDRLREVNALHGARAGDHVIAEVAERLRRMLREDQMIARVGGDEFVVAAPGMGNAAVERFCHHLLERMAAPITLEDGHEVSVSVSVGIALSPGDSVLPEVLLRAADTALSHSKREGYGHRSYHSQQFNARLRDQRKLLEDMCSSFAAGDFFLEYQPRFATHDRNAHSVEALVRWSHPQRGRISPADFIPLAEQSGLIVTLGEWILQEACETAARWSGLGVSVNLSPAQFIDEDLLRKVDSALSTSGLPAGLLELEVTEGVLASDSRRALEVLSALKGLGVKLAIDDFGTGYSSLSYLRNFPFDVLKIDQSFVRQLDDEDTARPIVQAILALGRAIGLSVTAEGVETESQFALLAQDGCDQIQGFLLARPLPAGQIDEIARQRMIGLNQLGQVREANGTVAANQAFVVADSWTA